MCSVDPETLAQIIRVSPNLRKLSLESCTVNREVLQHLSSLDGLDELNLCMAQEVDGAQLGSVLGKLSKLTTINIGWLNLSKSDVSRLVQTLPRGLEKLNLSGCRGSLLDKDVERLVVGCPQLTDLDLSDASSLTGEALMSLERLPSLQHLALSRCYRIPNPAQLSEYLRRLRSLCAVELFGLITEPELKTLSSFLLPVHINTHPFCSIARPTMSIRRQEYIWGMYCKA